MASYPMVPTYNPVPSGNGDHSFNSYAADGMELVTGSFVISSVDSTSSDGGGAITFKGLATVYFCDIQSNLGSNYFFAYNYSKVAVDMFIATATVTNLLLLIASDSSITGVGGYYMAMGPRG